jgi:predicted O-methyltransferase YrrM
MSGMWLSSGRRMREIRRRAGSAAAWVRTNIPCGRFLGLWALWLLRQAYRDRPVPLGVLRTLWKLLGSPDALVLGGQALPEAGKLLSNPFLAHELASVELGAWSLDIRTLDFLERQIQSRRPLGVLEFGSGVSTACLCRYMRELHGDPNQVYVTSIEQDLGVAKRTQELLKALCLDGNVRIVHSPLRDQTIEGRDTVCYDLPGHLLTTLLSNQRPDFVVIDGPAAKPGQRFGTLPMIESVLRPGAWFCLDDALRKGELDIGQLWARRPCLRVNGIHLFGKGLLVGQFVGKPAALPANCKGYAARLDGV